MSQKIRRFMALIGPYPYNPYLIFLFFFGLMISRFMPIAFYVPAGLERHRATAVLLFFSLVPALYFCLAGWLLEKYRFWSSKSLVLYILEVAIVQLFIFVYFPLVTQKIKNDYNYDFISPATKSFALFFFALFLFLFALAVIHRAERSVNRRLEKAKELVDQLKIDREELISADEQVREQTSRFLHDRVQSDLMVVGLKLKTVLGKSSHEVDEVLEAALSRLEKTRTSDLRDLVQILAPNFEAGGIKQALEVLSVQYQSSMKIIIEINSKFEQLASKELLGAFRIIEQSLLNALVHGPATQVLVSLKTNESGVSELIVSDNGPGISMNEISAGTGTAIIDSWVGILNGKKTVDTVPGHGYRLVINFPA
jgi:signal transduction histidine kinase